MALDELVQILDRAPDAQWESHPDDVSSPPFSLAEQFRALVQTHGATVLDPAFVILERRFRPLYELRDATAQVSAIDPRVMREIERWNIPGVALLVPEFAPLAEVVYMRLLTQLRELQSALAARLHKGTPYHMLGWAKLIQEDPSAREYFRLGAFEDAVKSDGEGWREEPAASVLARFWNADVELEWVKKLVRSVAHLDKGLRPFYVSNPELLMLRFEQEAS